MGCLELFLPTLIRRSIRQVITFYHSSPGVPVLVLLAATVNATGNEATPSLFIPLGSYLEHFNLGRIVYKQGEMYINKSPFGSKEIKLSFEAADNIPNPGSCWSQGYDLAKGNCTDLLCDTTTQRMPDEVSRFLYSAPMPYGSYLRKCTGIIRTLENNRYYLYAACLQAGWLSNSSDIHYTKNRLDITDCQNNIDSDTAGVLSCTDAPVQLKQILSGSYLSMCNLSDTNYDPDSGFNHIDSICGYFPKPVTLDEAGLCTGSRKDIAFTSDSIYPRQRESPLPEADNCSENGTSPTFYRSPPRLSVSKAPVCMEDPTKEVRLHIASRYIPAGSYLLTCRKMAFYPCMGPDRQGVLSAQCLNPQGKFQEAQLAYGDSECRMSKPGYVSNISGQLHCDPDSPFDNEDTTQGTDLSSHFQCNEE